jgi:hypothetical protein
MMKQKHRKMRRIAAVQEKLQRIAEWQLMECQAKEREAYERQCRLIERLNDSANLPQMAAQTAARHLTATTVEHRVLAEEKARQVSLTLNEARKSKQAQRMANAAASRVDCEEAKCSLEEFIEAAISRSAHEQQSTTEAPSAERSIA